jgi:hypothetical protein
MQEPPGALDGYVLQKRVPSPIAMEESLMRLTTVGAILMPALIALAVGVDPRALAAQPTPVILTSPAETPGQFTYAFVDPSANDGQWVAIDFHRDPGCSQLAAFNLLLFVDFPSAFACPLTVDVKEWWSAEDLAIAGGPWQTPPSSASFRTPSQARWLGRGAVPIYFVHLVELLDAIGDNVLTVSELESLPSLIIGIATKYHFIQLNSGAANSHPTMRSGHTQTVAHGRLEDGRSFLFHRTTGDNEVTSLKIDFK